MGLGLVWACSVASGPQKNKLWVRAAQPFPTLSSPTSLTWMGPVDYKVTWKFSYTGKIFSPGIYLWWISIPIAKLALFGIPSAGSAQTGHSEPDKDWSKTLCSPSLDQHSKLSAKYRIGILMAVELGLGPARFHVDRKPKIKLGLKIGMDLGWTNAWASTTQLSRTINHPILYMKNVLPQVDCKCSTLCPLRATFVECLSLLHFCSSIYIYRGMLS